MLMRACGLVTQGIMVGSPVRELNLRLLVLEPLEDEPYPCGRRCGRSSEASWRVLRSYYIEIGSRLKVCASPLAIFPETRRDPDEHARKALQAHQGRDRRLGGRRSGWRSMRRSTPAPSSSPARRPNSAASRTACLARRRGDAGHAAGDQRGVRAQAVRTGLGLKAKINLARSSTARTISIPTCRRAIRSRNTRADRRRGRGDRRRLADGEQIRVGIERLHLEQDAGKSLHDQTATKSFVDLNRSGVALMEIVSKPDMRSADEARAYVTKLRTILRYLGTCDGNMEKGSLRADVNVSVRRPGEPLGTRCEIKNVNSIRFIGQAIEAEARRQIGIIEDGGKIEQETRLFDPGTRRDALDALEGRGARLPLFPRSRSAAARIRPGLRRRCSRRLCRSCRTRRRRVSSRDYGLSAYDAGVLVADRETADYFEAVAKGRDAKLAANWVINELLRPAQQGGQGRSTTRRFPPRSSAPSSISSATARSPARSPRTCSRSSGARAAIRAPSSRAAA